MLWRIPARLVTGPLGFFVAGVVDVIILLGAILWATARKRLRAGQSRPSN